MSEPAAPGDATRPGALASAAKLAASAPLLAAYATAACALALVSRRRAYAVLRAWCAAQLRLFGVALEIEDASGLPARARDGASATPCVYVHLNQTSLIDAITWPLIAPRDCVSITNIEFVLVPVLGWMSAASGPVIVVRQWKRQARRAIARAEALLRAGRSVGVSIEGQRSRDGALTPYKKGPVRLAIATGAPIVPVVVHGARAALPYGEWRVRPGRVRARLCAAIPTAGLTEADRHALLARLRAVAERELGLAASPSAPGD